MSQPRWWIGVAWMMVSVLLLGFVAHVTLFGILQHDRSQTEGYQELRTLLAKAEAPLGQLGVDEKVVPAGTPVALLEIDEIGLTEVVRQGTSPDVLREAVGHRRDTVMPGQEGTSVLYGRQATYGGPFGQLAALVPGDIIVVTTGQDEHRYKVFGLRRPGDPAARVVARGRGSAAAGHRRRAGACVRSACCTSTPRSRATRMRRRHPSSPPQFSPRARASWNPIRLVCFPCCSLSSGWLSPLSSPDGCSVHGDVGRPGSSPVPFCSSSPRSTADRAMALLPNLI